mmetsp:Transcript_11137/g.25095  ORF Transcript_11137/g.25095 Transcript_11137/m.25095 type:complete len:214 (+) Transcript_11137:946-1587(+)
MLQVRIQQFRACCFMSGWRDPWSSTSPLTRLVSMSSFCLMYSVSIMYRSSGIPGCLTQRHASVTIGASMSASFSCTLVRSDVRATHSSDSRSTASAGPSVVAFMGRLTLSRYSSAHFLATSKPSQSTRECTPSLRYRSACFMSSPMSSTVEVVPSPVTSSCATAVRAIMTAVGFWICISRRRTFPSLVSFTSPAPPTSILIVPRGPRLVRKTS